jgi:type I restriction enzyme, R subunit
LRPEKKARKNIHKLLQRAGSRLQDYKELDLGASLGVDIREFHLGRTFADYILFIDRKAVWVIEAKQEEVIK